jgi:hypothetical protein
VLKAPTQKQIRKFTSLSEGTDEESAYVMLHDGTALVVLYKDGKTEYRHIDRRGKDVVSQKLTLVMGLAR